MGFLSRLFAASEKEPQKKLSLDDLDELIRSCTEDCSLNEKGLLQDWLDGYLAREDGESLILTMPLAFLSERHGIQE